MTDERRTTCDDCGEVYVEGDWPFCPHGRPTYMCYVAAGGGHLKKWTHMGSRSPR